MTPTIVLIPGLMCDAAMWVHQAPVLSRLGPIFIASTDRFDSLADMAADIARRTSGPLAVIGHSMGGRVALEVLAQAPERVAKLALLDTGAHGTGEKEAAGRLALVDIAFERGMDAVTESWLPPMMAPDASPQARAEMEAMVRRATPDILKRQQAALLGRIDRTDLLPKIACPTLVATGSLDAWASPDQHREIAEAIPNATLAIVEGSGHMLPAESPEALTELLVRLLQS